MAGKDGMDGMITCSCRGHFAIGGVTHAGAFCILLIDAMLAMSSVRCQDEYVVALGAYDLHFSYEHIFFPVLCWHLNLQAHLTRTLEKSTQLLRNLGINTTSTMETPSLSGCQRAPRTADIKGVIRVHRLVVRPRRNPQEQRWDKGANVCRYAKVESGDSHGWQP